MHTTAASPKTATKTLSNAFLKKKQHGEKIEKAKERAPSNPTNLISQSVKAGNGGNPSKSEKKAAPKKTGRTRRKKAG
jgi:hypothetical protein